MKVILRTSFPEDLAELKRMHLLMAQALMLLLECYMPQVAEKSV